VLGPLLFLIYVNDIDNATPVICEQVKLFADDTNLFISRKTAQDTVAVTNGNALYKWFVANRLSINFDKTCYMEVTLK